MKVFEINSFDGPQSGIILEKNTLKPAENEVVVSIKAASVNPLDTQIITGQKDAVFPISFPFIPGTDFSGIVEATGSKVSRFKHGDKVVGRMAPTLGGAFAQKLVITADSLCKIDSSMSFEQAAALPTAYGTAHLALIIHAQLQPKQRVLIHAGAGGVGSFAIQIAKQAGAYVIATGSMVNMALLRELGADEVIDYRHEDFTILQDIDVVLDTIGGDTLERSWRVLSKTGRIMSITEFSISSRGSNQGEFVFFKDATVPVPLAIEAFNQGKLKIIIDSIYSLDDTSSALNKVATGHAVGKVILRM